MKTNPELIIFDCDGVLVDSEPIANRVLAEELTKMGLPTSYEESIREYMGKSEADETRLITKKFGQPPPETFFERCARRTYRAFEKELRPIPGIEEALRSISSKMCVASSGHHEKIRKTLGLTGLTPFFGESIFSATDVTRGKPFPDLFLHAAKSLGVTPEHCAVVEDSVPGVQAAKAAKMVVFGYVALSSADQLRQAGAHLFNSMEELPKLLGF